MARVELRLAEDEVNVIAYLLLQIFYKGRVNPRVVLAVTEQEICSAPMG